MTRLAELEGRLAAMAVGLDPGLGVLHADRPGRDSLALDLIEPLRPGVEGLVLDLIGQRVFRKVDFAETRDGVCRVLPPLTHELAGTLGLWAREVGPWAERVTHVLAESSGLPIRRSTPLTGRRRRAAQAAAASQARIAAERDAARRLAQRKPLRRQLRISQDKLPVARRCEGCGNPLDHHQRHWCSTCWPAERTRAGIAGATSARTALNKPEIRRARGQAISDGKRDAKAARLALLGFAPEDWAGISTALQAVPLDTTTAATGLSTSSARLVRGGARVPAPRHWPALAQLAGVPPPERSSQPSGSLDGRRADRA